MTTVEYYPVASTSDSLLRANRELLRSSYSQDEFRTTRQERSLPPLHSCCDSRNVALAVLANTITRDVVGQAGWIHQHRHNLDISQRSRVPKPREFAFVSDLQC